MYIYNFCLKKTTCNLLKKTCNLLKRCNDSVKNQVHASQRALTTYICNYYPLLFEALSCPTSLLRHQCFLTTLCLRCTQEAGWSSRSTASTANVLVCCLRFYLNWELTRRWKWESLVGFDIILCVGFTCWILRIQSSQEQPQSDKQCVHFFLLFIFHRIMHSQKVLF